MTQQLPSPTNRADLIESKLDRDIAGKLAVTLRNGGTSFENMAEVLEFAKLMSISRQAVPPHCREQPGVCLGITIQAVEWRMSPFAVANKSYVVNDRLSYESQLIHAVVEQRAPITGRLRHEFSGEGGSRKCRVWAVDQKLNEELSYESPAFSDIQPKNSPLWKTKPDLQLYYNTSRDWARVYFPDVILGVYSNDELFDAALLNETSKLKVVTPIKETDQVKVISEDQRTALVDVAKDLGVVEKLGAIVNDAGFEMLAHITVDRYQDVKSAIIRAADSGVVDAEIVEDEPAADFVDPSILDEPVEANETGSEDTDPVDKLRANVQAAFDELPKSRQKDLLVGRPTVANMSVDELNQFAIDIRKE